MPEPSESRNDRFVPGKAERKQQRRKVREARRRRDAERDAYLRAQLEVGEAEVAHGYQALITTRRILLSWRVGWPPHQREWTHDGITFDEVSAWAIGRRHDGRPLIRLEHPSHVRLEWGPAHQVLWFRWGNKAAEVSHEKTTLPFRSDRDPVFIAIRSRLEMSYAIRLDSFLVRLPGTRDERTRTSTAVLGYTIVRYRRLSRLRGQIAQLDEHLHHGQIAWRIRIGSWLILAAPAWFIEPWLAAPAVALAEIAWIVGLQWQWHRDQRRPVRDQY